MVSPAVVLSVANASTVRRTWSEWSTLTSRGAGRKIDPDRALGDAMNNAPQTWRSMVVNKDNLLLNSCIMCLEERGLETQASNSLEDPSAIPTLLALSCSGHSGVLSTKPLYDRSKLPTVLVRLGHQMASGRVKRNLDNALKEIFKEIEYVVCDAFPCGHSEWQAYARRTLEMTMGANDLIDDEKKRLLVADNGNWESEAITHYCLRGRCLLGCRGERDGKNKVARQIKLAVSLHYTTPLKYRWKGMDVAGSLVLRWQREHSLLLRVLRIIYPVTARKKVQARLQALENQVAAAALGGMPGPNIEEETVRLKFQLKGRGVLAIFRGGLRQRRH